MPRIRLEKTCYACPEQYDAYIDGKQLGYLRLRHGCFSADYRGETVFTGGPRGDGCFDPDERDLWLNRACRALLEAHDGLKDTELLFVIGDNPDDDE